MAFPILNAVSEFPTFLRITPKRKLHEYEEAKMPGGAELPTERTKTTRCETHRPTINNMVSSYVQSGLAP